MKFDPWEWHVPIGWERKKSTTSSFQNRNSALKIEESEKIVSFGGTISLSDLNFRWDEGLSIVKIGNGRVENAIQNETRVGIRNKRWH
jgi:hypothetical protein